MVFLLVMMVLLMLLLLLLFFDGNFVIIDFNDGLLVGYDGAALFRTMTNFAAYLTPTPHFDVKTKVRAIRA